MQRRPSASSSRHAHLYRLAFLILTRGWPVSALPRAPECVALVLIRVIQYRDQTLVHQCMNGRKGACATGCSHRGPVEQYQHTLLRLICCTNAAQPRQLLTPLVSACVAGVRQMAPVLAPGAAPASALGRHWPAERRVRSQHRGYKTSALALPTCYSLAHYLPRDVVPLIIAAAQSSSTGACRAVIGAV